MGVGFRAYEADKASSLGKLQDSVLCRERYEKSDNGREHAKDPNTNTMNL